QYIDPQDGTPVQFIASGLKPNTAYSFRVRTYSGNTAPVYGSYSTPVAATTANYAVKYVSTTGNDANDGTAPDSGHAWRTINHGSSTISCGQVLIVMGGSYSMDRIIMGQSCTAASKAVVMANPGDVVTITSSTMDPPVQLLGSHNVLDGIKSAVSTALYQV